MATPGRHGDAGGRLCEDDTGGRLCEEDNQVPSLCVLPLRVNIMVSRLCAQPDYYQVGRAH